MDEQKTNQPPNRQNNMQQPEKSDKAMKITLLVIVAIILVAAAIAAGFFIGQYNKNQEVERAKQEAQQQAQPQQQSDDSNGQQSQSDRPAHEQAPAKTTTDPTCNADELALSVAPGAEGASAGAATYEVVLENTGNRNCHLGGYPGVSLVNDNGNQIGQPAERVTGQDEPIVQMAPGARTQATISVPNSTNFNDGQCQDGATKLRVYPPNDTGYLSAATEVTTWCPGFTVAPVTPM